jgi:hypothetical protein
MRSARHTDEAVCSAEDDLARPHIYDLRNISLFGTTFEAI